MRRKLLGAAILVSVFTAGFFGVANAQSFRSGDTPVVQASEKVDGTLWISGRTVDIAGEVSGDVFCAGQNVTVSGTVRGDLLCAAQTIVISGTVLGDVRSVAQTITVTGTVFHNLSAAAQSFNQSTKGDIRDDASIAANDISLNGSVGRDVALASATANLNGQIGRNVQATTDSLSLGSGAKIAGDLSYTSENTVRLASGAVVEGQATKHAPKKDDQKSAASLSFGGLGFMLYLLAAALLVALVLVLLFPQVIHAIAAQGRRSPWKALLVGLVAAVVVPILFAILMLSIIGIPLGLLLLGVWLLIQAFAGIVATYYVGKLVWRRQRNPVLIVLIGAVLLSILYLIPVVGAIVFAAAMLLGTGMILLELNRLRPAPKYNLE